MLPIDIELSNRITKAVGADEETPTPALCPTKGLAKARTAIIIRQILIIIKSMLRIFF